MMAIGACSLTVPRSLSLSISLLFFFLTATYRAQSYRMHTHRGTDHLFLYVYRSIVHAIFHSIALAETCGVFRGPWYSTLYIF